MFSLFTRNYVMTFLGMLFFGIMFFSNLDMVFQSNTILTENGIPNFVGWLLPMMLFLYFWLFFIFQNRLLFGCKKAKKSLKLLFLLVSILYSLISIVLFIYVIAWYVYLITPLIIWLLLAFKNFYYHIKVKHKQYFWKLKKKVFFKNLTIYWIILTLFLAVYNRPIRDIQVPEGYFNIEALVAKENTQIKLWDELKPLQYVQQLSLKKYKNLNYDIIIYNLPEDIINHINDIYNTTLNLPELWKNNFYDFDNVIQAQKISLLKYEYEVLHWKTEESILTLKNILEINHNILNYNSDYYNTIVFTQLQSLALDRVNNHLDQYNPDDKWTIADLFITLDVKQIIKNISEQEFNYYLWKISYFYNIPLVINKSEMFDASLYLEYVKSENIAENFDQINIKKLSRKNYYWLSLINIWAEKAWSDYIKLQKLSEDIQELKNTLN